MTADVPDVDMILATAGFDPDTSVLTRRQAEVLALRERDISQAAIAEVLGTSRANVSKVESSARDNVARAKETVAFAETLKAPVQIDIEPGTDLYEVPDRVYDACDENGVKVPYSAPEVMKLVSDNAGDAIAGREIRSHLLVGVTSDGTMRVRSRPEA
ncbi:MAG: Tfx family DNA-binding protein [Halobacteriota archaeon]